MAIGFPVDCKWVSPNQPPLSSRPLCSHKEWDASFIPTKMSCLYSISEGSKSMPNHSLKSYAWDSGAAKANNKDSMTIEEINIHRKCPSGSISLSTNLEKAVTKDILKCPSYLAKSDSAQYILLMENLSEIEDALVDSELEKLKSNILIQIKRLGALQLFQSCLSRTFMAPDFVSTTVPLIEHSSVSTLHEGDETSNIAVDSMKKQERKLRRKQATEKLYKISTPSSSSNAVKQVEKFCVSSANTTSMSTSSSNSSRRIQIARNESKMAVGVKEVSDLEWVRLKLEGKIGRPASFAKWAEAAAIDEETLKQRLHFGWLCKDRLIKSTRSLVVYLAKSYAGMGLGFEDLIQAGNVGVLLGSERFDSTKGYRFSTYVQHWIRKSMSELVACHSRGIRIPATVDKIIKQIKKTRRSLSSNTGIHPKDNEIAAFTGISLAKVRLANRCSRPMGSFEQTLRGSWNIKFSEITPDTSIEAPETAVMKLHMRNNVHKLLEGLNCRERQVLLLRYGLGDGRCKSLSEIGQLFHVSKEWIRKIEKVSLSKLRMKGIQGELKHYLDI